MSSLILEASEHKEKGNKYYQQGRYEVILIYKNFLNKILIFKDALSHYNRAIIKASFLI